MYRFSVRHIHAYVRALLAAAPTYLDPEGSPTPEPA